MSGGGIGGGSGSRRNSEARIMITSMMDIFTIILAFLLFQFTTDDQSILIAGNMDLPNSSAQLQYKNGVRVSVTKNSVEVSGKKVADIKNGKLIGKIQDKKILSLFNELSRLKMTLPEGKTEEQKEYASTILFESDRKAPYHIVDSVLKTAGMAGFPKIRMVVQGHDG